MFRLIFIMLIFCSSFSQGTTHILLFDLNQDGGKISLSNMNKITHEDVYNNQPSFSLDGKSIYYVSKRDGEQTDIFQYQLKSSKSIQKTHTKESEYSPLEFQKNFCSAVRVDQDGKQRLYKINLKKEKAELLHKNTKGVGYYAWVNEHTIAFFHIEKPFHLRLIDTKTGDWKRIVNNIGRSLIHDPQADENIYFIRNHEDHETITKLILDGDDSKMEAIVDMKYKSLDFCMMQNGVFLSGNRKNLYKYDPKKDKKWVKIYNGRKDDVSVISRLAVNKQMDKIALVVTM